MQGWGKECSILCWACANWKCKSRSNTGGLMRVAVPWASAKWGEQGQAGRQALNDIL